MLVDGTVIELVTATAEAPGLYVGAAPAIAISESSAPIINTLNNDNLLTPLPTQAPSMEMTEATND